MSSEAVTLSKYFTAFQEKATILIFSGWWAQGHLEHSRSSRYTFCPPASPPPDVLLSLKFLLLKQTFPEDTCQITLSLTPPSTHPPGSHAVPVYYHLPDPKSFSTAFFQSLFLHPSSPIGRQLSLENCKPSQGNCLLECLRFWASSVLFAYSLPS